MSVFLKPWRTFFEQATDAADEYGELAGLVALASIASGHRSMPYGNGVIPPLFAMLVAGPGKDHKSTVIDWTEELVRQVVPLRVGAADFTTEALFISLTKKDETVGTLNKRTIFASEFGSNLAQRTRYAEGMFPDLCKLYDGKTFERARVDRTIEITTPRVSFFAGCAFQMMRSYLRPEDWDSGFLTRFLYAAPLTRPRTFKTAPQFPRPYFDAAAAELEQVKLRISTIPGNRNGSFEMLLTSGAKYCYEDFQQHIDNLVLRDQHRDADPRGFKAAYASRFGNNILKLAMLYQIDLDPHSPVVDYPAMHTAGRFGEKLWQSFQLTLDQLAPTGYDLAIKLLTIMRQQPEHGYTGREIGGFLSVLERPMLSQALDQLQRTYMVRRVTDTNGTRFFVTN